MSFNFKLLMYLILNALLKHWRIRDDFRTFLKLKDHTVLVSRFATGIINSDIVKLQYNHCK